ncbi:MAG TPA: PepSY domain-containing protein [Allosphingosinicella sp.]|jgi:uncharacterized membrane protein YkoI
MFSRLLLILAALGPLLIPLPAESRPRDREQESAWRGMQEGRFLSLRRIESMIVPRMGGADYLGPELDAGAGRYRLKFMRGGQVIWVDVDARTGQVIGQSR